MCIVNQLSSALRGGFQDIADMLRSPRAATESLVVRVDYSIGEAVNVAVPSPSVVFFLLGTEQRMAVDDSHCHTVRCKRLAPRNVSLKSTQHLSVKRNSRSCSYVLVFPTTKGQTLQMEEVRR